MSFGQAVSILRDIVSTIAIFVAGAWTYVLYIRRRTGVWNLVMTTDAAATQYGDGLALLTCRVLLRNAGGVRIIPGSNGCRISVRQVPRTLPRGTAVQWDDLKPDLVENHDLLQPYLRYTRREEPLKEDYEGVYSIEPAAEYHEQLNVVVPCGFAYLIEVTFWWRGNSDSITEYATAFVA
ncbi:MAG TPA: hypothetical protein VFN10_14175 [Thermoanaerobaculia bacterium]|nr:hypothetical protein [Thermoanaerobaculia bacterium]